MHFVVLIIIERFFFVFFFFPAIATEKARILVFIKLLYANEKFSSVVIFRLMLELESSTLKFPVETPGAH